MYMNSFHEEVFKKVCPITNWYVVDNYFLNKLGV